MPQEFEILNSASSLWAEAYCPGGTKQVPRQPFHVLYLHDLFTHRIHSYQYNNVPVHINNIFLMVSI